MRTVTKPVSTGKPRKVVGEVDIPVYDTIDELIENEDEAIILSLFNQQNAVRLMGNERAKHTMGRIGKGRRFEIAYNLLRDVVSEEEFMEAIGNIETLKSLIASDKVQLAVDEYIAGEQAKVDAS